MQNYKTKLNISSQIEDIEIQDVICPTYVLTDIPK